MSASANDPIMALAGSRVSVDQSFFYLSNGGRQVFLAGLAAQLLSFLSFSCIYLIFLYRLRKHDPEIWAMDTTKKWYNSWIALAGALLISCIGILVSWSLDVMLGHFLTTNRTGSIWLQGR